ncbi:hypothetical protein MKZ07_24885 [Paenibacillus sp. FSL P4-0338]|uniref:hypothetical protein n=1 Tax=Paenibacillus sp. FSL P4-0338 TaxID=2921635 RepID=UPI0026A25767
MNRKRDCPFFSVDWIYGLVAQCQEAGILGGTHVAIDSAAIYAYEKKEPKRKSELTGNANWGVKLDTFGNKVK